MKALSEKSRRKGGERRNDNEYNICDICYQQRVQPIVLAIGSSIRGACRRSRTR